MSKENTVWRGCVVVLLALIFGAVVLVASEMAGSGEVGVERGSTSYGWFREEQVVLSGSGTEGAVEDSELTDGPIRGHLYALHLDFAETMTNTTDVTVTLASPALTILQLTDYYTDTWYYPAGQQTGSDGSGSSTYDRLPVSGRVTVAVGETISNVTGIMTATLWWGD